MFIKKSLFYNSLLISFCFFELQACNLILPTNSVNSTTKETSIKIGIIDKWNYGNLTFIEKNGNKTASSISGTLELKKDGTFNWNYYNGYYNNFEGTYEISGDKIILKYNNTNRVFTYSIGKDTSGLEWLTLKTKTGYDSEEIHGLTRELEVNSSKPSITPSLIPSVLPSPQVTPTPLNTPTPTPSVSENKLIWSQIKNGVSDIPSPVTVLPDGNELLFGGINLENMEKTKTKDKADLRFEGAYLYARAITTISNNNLEISNEIPTSGYVSYVKYEVGKTYLLKRYDNSYAKVKVEQILSREIIFSYVLQVKK